ncbi:hypothetical protein [Olleya sp. YS]|uniref:hypothetical protein n=1 Tax=Olleya sp. YS TaxID=3028318 RepID=UPI0024345DC1|nr:hypothetical protein [Olleya sp. YS]WGD34916.1 hypothetical protein Ollyesu_00540 [Olleya sp. YS]
MKKATLFLLSLIFCHSIFATTKDQNTSSAINNVQIVRLDFTAPNGASRELILGFTADNSASDGIDYGYDASVSSPFANDLNWLIEDNRYVIQGVGSYQETSQYLFGMYSEIGGSAKIELISLENFESDINVYIYDALLDTYTNINDSAYIGNIDAGNYTDRFYITFNEPAAENDSVDTSDISDNSNSSNLLGPNGISSLKPKKKSNISYLISNNQLKVSANDEELIKEITIYDYNGTALESVKDINKVNTLINIDADNKILIVHIVTENETIVKKIILSKK